MILPYGAFKVSYMSENKDVVEETLMGLNTLATKTVCTGFAVGLYETYFTVQIKDMIEASMMCTKLLIVGSIKQVDFWTDRVEL